LEIVSSEERQLNGKQSEINVEVKIFPENATYQDITWRVTNEKGVDSNIVSLLPDGRNAALKALGDGRFYLRAAAKNGDKKIHLISVLEFEIKGLGTAYFNPYEFISGSLYSKTFGEVGGGNERGVATSRDGESIVVYDKLDFGDFGSDEITIPIFELGSKATRIEIWEGVPHTADSERIADVVYHKKSIWNTYQEETYRLKKPLTGITSISFLLRDKIHIKGFSFTKREKAYEQLPILNYSSLYGDNYTVGEGAITGIGNNVTITFQDMDFGTKGFSRLIICGRSAIDKNTIHIRFNNGNHEMVQLAEFLYSGDYAEREFTLEGLTGLQNVSFLFLPGSNFDFKWFRFE
jgi:beta-galactosidase